MKLLVIFANVNIANDTFSPESCEFIVVKLFSITCDILYETITNDH